jgi:hypothetical protein
MSGALPQAKPVHDTARVVRVVTHAETRQDSLGEARGGPAIGIETRGSRSRMINFGRLSELFHVQPAGTPWRAPLP